MWKITKEFAALREKTYSYLIEKNDEDKKAKCAIKLCRYKTKTWIWKL